MGFGEPSRCAEPMGCSDALRCDDSVGGGDRTGCGDPLVCGDSMGADLSVCGDPMGCGGFHQRRPHGRLRFFRLTGREDQRLGCCWVEMVLPKQARKMGVVVGHGGAAGGPHRRLHVGVRLHQLRHPRVGPITRHAQLVARVRASISMCCVCPFASRVRSSLADAM